MPLLEKGMQAEKTSLGGFLALCSLMSVSAACIILVLNKGHKLSFKKSG